MDEKLLKVLNRINVFYIDSNVDRTKIDFVIHKTPFTIRSEKSNMINDLIAEWVFRQGNNEFIFITTDNDLLVELILKLNNITDKPPIAVYCPNKGIAYIDDTYNYISNNYDLYEKSGEVHKLGKCIEDNLYFDEYSSNLILKTKCCDEEDNYSDCKILYNKNHVKFGILINMTEQNYMGNTDVKNMTFTFDENKISFFEKVKIAYELADFYYMTDGKLGKVYCFREEDVFLTIEEDSEVEEYTVKQLISFIFKLLIGEPLDDDDKVTKKYFKLISQESKSKELGFLYEVIEIAYSGNLFGFDADDEDILEFLLNTLKRMLIIGNIKHKALHEFLEAVDKDEDIMNFDFNG